MERIRGIQSKITDIINLINTNREGIYDSFVNDLKINGGPLEEEYDDKYSLVTFIYISRFECKNVLLILPTIPENYEEDLMEKIEGTDLWYSVYKIRNDVRFGYYFSPNDSLKKNCSIRHRNLEKDVFNSNYTILDVKSSGQTRIRSNFVLNKVKPHEINLSNCNDEKGRIVEYYFDSKILDEKRRVRIYLPFAYEDTIDDLNYLLLTDGEEHLDHLSVELILDNLIYQKKIPKMISILIDSTEKRYDELKCSDRFANFIVDELLPWIRTKYRISKDPNKAIVSGVSLGGLTATYLAIKHPDIFRNVLSQSGSFWYTPKSDNEQSNICWISHLYSTKQSKNIKLYFNVGIYETKDMMLDTNEYFKETLLNNNYDFEFEYFNSGHDYLSWGEYLGRGLISLSRRRMYDIE